MLLPQEVATISLPDARGNFIEIRRLRCHPVADTTPVRGMAPLFRPMCENWNAATSADTKRACASPDCNGYSPDVGSDLLHRESYAPKNAVAIRRFHDALFGKRIRFEANSFYPVRLG